jgi:hypothetical protein
MNKNLLFQKLKTEVDLQLKLAVEAAQNTLDVATHEESKPENKYDTRGLEASYLARAQSERVLDLKGLRNGLESLKIRDFDSDQRIALTALVNLESNGKNLWVLLLPKGGGQSFQHDGISVKVITPESPLGAQLVGKSVDDVIQIKNTEYLVVEII